MAMKSGLDELLATLESDVVVEPDILEKAPIISAWNLFAGNKDSWITVIGVVQGRKNIPDGHHIRTSAVASIARDRTWVKTQNTLYRLGPPASISDTRPPLVVALTAFDWNSARTALLSLRNFPQPVLDVIDRTIDSVIKDEKWDAQNWDCRRKFATAMCMLFVDADIIDMADAWAVLTVNPEDKAGCGVVFRSLEKHEENLAPSIAIGWLRLMEGWPHAEDDPIVAARWVGRATASFPAEREEEHEEEREGGGVVVIAKLGGRTTGGDANALKREFEDLIGEELPLYPAPDVAKARAILVSEFPHAERLIDVLLSDLVGRAHVQFRPTIIIGPPGCGKSRLSRRVGEVCGLYVGRFDGAGAADSTFGGTPRRWASAEACWPMLVIKSADHANPLILIDELDKAGTSRHNGNLQLSLLPMFDRETSARFPDPYIQQTVDLSYVSYLMTVNDDTGLPLPLKDRCRLLKMPPITVHHVPALARGILADLAADRGLDPRWVSPLNGDEIEIAQRMLGDGSLRRLRVVIDRLLALRETRAMRN